MASKNIKSMVLQSKMSSSKWPRKSERNPPRRVEVNLRISMTKRLGRLMSKRLRLILTVVVLHSSQQERESECLNKLGHFSSSVRWYCGGTTCHTPPHC